MARATEAPVRRSIIEGPNIICPRCKRPHDILKYKRYLQTEEFAHATVPVYQCPSCLWIFALAPDEIVDTVRNPNLRVVDP